MKIATFMESGKMVITEIAKPVIEKETDAIIKIVRACVCGSDLWWYRGINKREANTYAGHEAIGIVEEVGAAVTNVQVGDFVIVPFTHGCGECQPVALVLMVIVPIVKLSKIVVTKGNIYGM